MAGVPTRACPPLLRLASCSQGPNCRHLPSEVSGHLQKQFQEAVQLLLPIPCPSWALGLGKWGEGQWSLPCPPSTRGCSSEEGWGLLSFLSLPLFSSGPT